MLFVAPVTVFSLAFFWVAILIHTQVPDHGTQGLQPRLPRRILGRVVGDERKYQHGPGLGLRMPPEPHVRTSQASVDRPPRGGRSCEFAYTTCVQNLETSRQNLEGLRDTVQYLFEQSPEEHPSTHAHYQDILHSIEDQEKGLLHIQAVFRSHL